MCYFRDKKNRVDQRFDYYEKEDDILHLIYVIFLRITKWNINRSSVLGAIGHSIFTKLHSKKKSELPIS